jgi:hypothetical protein
LWVITCHHRRNSDAQLALKHGDLGGQGYLMLQSGIKLSLDRIESSFDSCLLVVQCLAQSDFG